MKAYKITLLVIDHEDMGEDEIVTTLEENSGIDPRVLKIEGADIGEWDDDHPLNQIDWDPDAFWPPPTTEGPCPTCRGKEHFESKGGECWIVPCPACGKVNKQPWL